MKNMSLTFEEAEEVAFERWIEKTCPSGDVSEVQQKWKESDEYSNLLDEYEDFLT